MTTSPPGPSMDDETSPTKPTTTDAITTPLTAAPPPAAQEEASAPEPSSPKSPSDKIKEVVRKEFGEKLKTVAVQDPETLRELRRVWSGVLQRHGSSPLSDPHDDDYDELNPEEKKNIHESEEKRASLVLQGAKESSEAFKKSYRGSCLVCQKKVEGSHDVYVFYHTRDTVVHLAHRNCYESMPSHTFACLECTVLSKGPLPTSFRRRDQPVLAVMGHGNDADEDTFVPLGMTLYTYAEPGKLLSTVQATEVCANPLSVAPKGIFPEGATLPNIPLGPPTEYELELDVVTWASARSLEFSQAVAMLRKGEGDVTWIAGTESLCTEVDLCRRPFHTCRGILARYRGVKNLYIGVCMGSGGLGDAPTEIDEFYEQLSRLFVQQIESNEPGASEKALFVYASLPKNEQTALFRIPRFSLAYEAAMEVMAEGETTIAPYASGPTTTNTAPTTTTVPTTTTTTSSATTPEEKRQSKPAIPALTEEKRPHPEAITSAQRKSLQKSNKGIIKELQVGQSVKFDLQRISASETLLIIHPGVGGIGPLEFAGTIRMEERGSWTEGTPGAIKVSLPPGFTVDEVKSLFSSVTKKKMIPIQEAPTFDDMMQSTVYRRQFKKYLKGIRRTESFAFIEECDRYINDLRLPAIKLQGEGAKRLSEDASIIFLSSQTANAIKSAYAAENGAQFHTSINSAKQEALVELKKIYNRISSLNAWYDI
ncbi:putative adhesin [Streptomyces sp. NPDC048419]|uniref:putative adhesin n=1 Tax=Streptomyces sp. NPDC048419 TaxID=3365547 RepID=UPI003721BB8B